MPTKKEINEFLVKGRELTLPDGSPGFFSRYCKGNKSQAWVIRGTVKEPGATLVVAVKALVEKNMDDEE